MKDIIGRPNENIGKVENIENYLHEAIEEARKLEQENINQQARKVKFIQAVTEIQADSLIWLRRAFE